VVFPLEALVPAVMLAALFRLCVGLVVWLAFWLCMERSLPPLSIVTLPAVLLPLCFVTAGAAWLAASLGVYLRDLAHGVGPLVQLLAFITPVYYSLDRVDNPALRQALSLNLRPRHDGRLRLLHARQARLRRRHLERPPPPRFKGGSRPPL
jgi:ABC-type polysaccharide/polyol phosphate export permease